MIDQPAEESEFLMQLFTHLNSAGVSYAVMRNHEPLPYSAGGSDLDLIVDLADGDRTRAAILESIRAAGGAPIGIAESAGFFKVYALGRATRHPMAWWGLRIDVNVGLYFKGSPLIEAGADLPVRFHHDIPVLSDGFAGVLGVLKEALNNNIFPVRYAKAARTAAIEDWAMVTALLAPIGKNALDILHAMLFCKSSPDALSVECKRLRAAVLRQAFRKAPIKMLWRRVKYESFKARRFIQPPGVMIAILGVDGAGKSTLTNAVLPALNAATHNAVLVQHLRPGLLPPLARWKGRDAVSAGTAQHPHSSTCSGILGSLFRLTYLTLDYRLGYWLKTRPKIAKQPTVIIYDRYAYDMELDPRRFRVRVPRWTSRWFVALAPKPDLIFCLYGTPEVIAARKMELPLEETTRQIGELHRFARGNPRAVLISTDNDMYQARDEMLQYFVNWLSGRANSR